MENMDWTTNGFHQNDYFLPRNSYFWGHNFLDTSTCVADVQHVLSTTGKWLTIHSRERCVPDSCFWMWAIATQRIPNRFALAARKSGREKNAWHDDGSLFEGTAFRNTYPLYCPPDPTGSMLDLLRLGFWPSCGHIVTNWKLEIPTVCAETGSFLDQKSKVVTAGTAIHDGQSGMADLK